jgi:topoisomerase-4 subunit A
MGEGDNLWLMSASNGYGFVAKLDEMQTKQKAGKATVSVAKGATTLPPQRLHDYESDLVAVVTNEGKLLIFPVTELPQMSRGKGVQTLKIQKAKGLLQDEQIVATAIIPAGGSLTVYAGKRYVTLKGADLEPYIGKRAQRGLKLPRGFQNVYAIASVDKWVPAQDTVN